MPAVDWYDKSAGKADSTFLVTDVPYVNSSSGYNSIRSVFCSYFYCAVVASTPLRATKPPYVSRTLDAVLVTPVGFGSTCWLSRLSDTYHSLVTCPLFMLPWYRAAGHQDSAHPAAQSDEAPPNRWPFCDDVLYCRLEAEVSNTDSFFICLGYRAVLVPLRCSSHHDDGVLTDCMVLLFNRQEAGTDSANPGGPQEVLTSLRMLTLCRFRTKAHVTEGLDGQSNTGPTAALTQFTELEGFELQLTLTVNFKYSVLSQQTVHDGKQCWPSCVAYHHLLAK